MPPFVFLIFLLLAIITGGIVYLLYLPIKLWLIRTGKLSKKLSRKVNLVYVGLLFVTVIAITYTALFPGEEFYAEEFKTVTLRELPDSAEFISKQADYPDFHGDYCSHSIIKLTKTDYNKLLSEIKKDSRLIREDSNEKKILCHFIRQLPDKQDHYLDISFDNDGQTIYINICVT
jgi:hypothetical protein